MAKSDDLQKQAGDLRAKMAEMNAKVANDKNASDEAAHRYESENLKVKAEELERKANQARKDEVAGEKSGLF